MKNILILIITFFIVIPQIVSSQITPDSLIGTYVGENWFKWEYEIEWQISIDTSYIISINENICYVSSLGVLAGPYFETEYDFCYGNSENWYTRFYAQDSLKVIYDDISLPPPNDELFSKRYFGKKISSDILLPTIDLFTDNIKVFPNPFNKQIIVELGSLTPKNSYNLQLLNLNSYEIFVESQLEKNDILINTEVLKPGVYILKLSNENFIKTFKIIKL